MHQERVRLSSDSGAQQLRQIANTRERFGHLASNKEQLTNRALFSSLFTWLHKENLLKPRHCNSYSIQSLLSLFAVAIFYLVILHSSPYAALNQFRQNSEQSKHQDDFIKLDISNLELYQNLIVAIFWCYIGQFVLSLSLLLLYFVRQSRHRLLDFLPAPLFLLLKLLTAVTLLVSVRLLYLLLTNALKNEITKLLQDGSQTAREQLQDGTECCDILLSNNERSRIDDNCHHSKEVPTCTEMFIGIFDGQRAKFIIFFILHTVVLFKYCSVFVKWTQFGNNDRTPSGEDQLQLIEQNGQAQQQPRTVSSGQENKFCTPVEERVYSLTETVNRDRVPKDEVIIDGNRGTQIISGPTVLSGMRFHSEASAAVRKRSERRVEFHSDSHPLLREETSRISIPENEFLSN